jgi:hypothetical protein
VPAAFDLAEVFRVHPSDPAGDVLERLASLLADATDGLAE